ncbi:MAG: hypothetical protein L6R42_000265 [Xanthoria sp. 1 TBL-2021]|nr:MAG: hypothetical protein L6R42_000265 [Xanthoria sp. 1 TBL-2021]
MPISRRESEAAADTEARPGQEQEELQPSSAIRFPPEEEEAVRCMSHLPQLPFGNQMYDPISDHLIYFYRKRPFQIGPVLQAISVYDRALASVPNYLEYEIAVLKSNIAACRLRLSDWKAAVEEATKPLEALDRLGTPPASKSDGNELEGSESARSGNHNDLGNHRQHVAAAKDDSGVVKLADDEENEAEALEKI